MRPALIATLVRKELLETLRDKRTLITMFGIPILLYPLLIVVVGQVAILQESKVERRISRVAVAEDATPTLRQWLDQIEKVELVSLADPNEQILTGRADAAILAPTDRGLFPPSDGSADVRIRYDTTSDDSRRAMQRVRDALRDHSEKLLAERLTQKGLDRAFVHPLRIYTENIAAPQKVAGSLLGTILPMLMIVMLAAGAFHPAIDLTAGEKERGTFETLLSAPITKAEIVCGKFITLLSLCLTTGILSLASMTVSLAFQFSQAIRVSGERALADLPFTHLSPTTLVLLLLMLVPLAFFICSVMMSLAVLARDYKEAQAFVTPFYIVILLPAMITTVPGMRLSAGTKWIPIANVALLFKDALMGSVEIEAVFAVLLSTAIYAMLALIAAIRLFETEDVILSQERGLALSWHRSRFIPAGRVSAGMALVLFGLVLLLVFYAGTYVQIRSIISGLLITEWLLIAAPVVGILWYTRMDLRRALNWRGCSARSLVAAGLLAAGMWVLIMQVRLWQEQVLPQSETVSEQMTRMLDAGRSARGTVLLLLAGGLSPAICEEILFRGAILSGLRSRLSAPMAVVVTSILFGLMHQNVYMLLHTTLLGLALGYVTLVTHSIAPAMLFHGLINTFSLLAGLGRLPAGLLERLEAWQQQGGFPGWLLMLSVALVAISLLILGRRASASIPKDAGSEVD